MKFFAINGSHRKDGNTAQLLEKALEGIKSVCSDAEIESVNLYDVPFNGCKSCFACKKINGRHYGKCVYKDDFKPILEEIVQADGVILGSPVYFGDVSGVMRCFLERFIFPFFVYDEDMTSLAPKKMAIGCIYTMSSYNIKSRLVSFYCRRCLPIKPCIHHYKRPSRRAFCGYDSVLSTTNKHILHFISHIIYTCHS